MLGHRGSVESVLCRPGLCLLRSSVKAWLFPDSLFLRLGPVLLGVLQNNVICCSLDWDAYAIS